MTVRVPSFVGHEHAIGVGDEVDEVEALDRFAVRPATLEVRFPVQAIVEGTCEVKIIGDDLLEGGPVFGYIGFIRGSSYRYISDCRVLYTPCRHLEFSLRLLLLP